MKVCFQCNITWQCLFGRDKSPLKLHLNRYCILLFIQDELEPDVEQGDPDNTDAEEDNNEESDCLPRQSGT